VGINARLGAEVLFGAGLVFFGHGLLFNTIQGLE
jgi:hypothetical protein